MEASKPDRWEPRLDFWGAISDNKPLAIDIMKSSDRKKLNVKGYGKERTRSFFRKKLAPKIAKEMKHKDVIICMGKGFKFTVDEYQNWPLFVFVLKNPKRIQFQWNWVASQHTLYTVEHYQRHQS